MRLLRNLRRLFSGANRLFTEENDVGIMKAKDLIKILEVVNPETEVSFCIGKVGYRGDEFRKKYAKVELISGESLVNLGISEVSLCVGEEESLLDFTLESTSYDEEEINDLAEQYDIIHKK